MQVEMQHDECLKQLPFYVAGVLASNERVALARHLDNCETCQEEVKAWEHIASTVRQEAVGRAASTPPLSPLVRASLRRPLSVMESAREARQLILAQWPVLRAFLPAAIVVLLMTVAGTLALRENARAALPLIALAPVVAALSVAFLHHREADPAWELVEAAPTRTGALVFARMTLLLAPIAGLMLLASVVVSLVTGQILGALVAAWLGPMMFLSALATVLTLRWGVALGMGVPLALWASLIWLLVAELSGRAAPPLTLLPLLDPGWLILTLQLLGAALLWRLSWQMAERRPLAAQEAL